MLEKAKCIIVEVNPNQPYCYGGFDCGIRIDDVDMIVEAHDSPMGKLVVSAEPGDSEWAIARQVVEEIPNGACMQLGIGVLPTAVGRLIADSDLKDLGVQTEMYVDAFWTWLSPAASLASARTTTRAVRPTPSPPAPRSSMTIWTTTPSA